MGYLPLSPFSHLSPLSLSRSLSLSLARSLMHPLYEPLSVHSQPTSITAQKFKEPNWPHLSQCWMQMEFLLLREVQLVTPAAPTSSIYCRKVKPAQRQSPHYIRATLWARLPGQRGHGGEVTTTLTTHTPCFIQFSLNHIFLSFLFSI